MGAGGEYNGSERIEALERGFESAILRPSSGKRRSKPPCAPMTRAAPASRVIGARGAPALPLHAPAWLPLFPSVWGAGSLKANGEVPCQKIGGAERLTGEAISQPPLGANT